MAQKLSHQLRAAENRIAELEAEVGIYQDKADRAEQWLHKVYTEIEERFPAAGQRSPRDVRLPATTSGVKTLRSVHLKRGTPSAEVAARWGPPPDDGLERATNRQPTLGHPSMRAAAPPRYRSRTMAAPKTVRKVTTSTRAIISECDLSEKLATSMTCRGMTRPPNRGGLEPSLKLGAVGSTARGGFPSRA